MGKRCDLCLIPTRFHGKKGVTFCSNITHGAVLKTKGSIFIYFISFFCLIFCGDFWDKLTVVLKVTALCHARAFFVRFFFALVLILLWTGKRCDLCLILTRFHGKKVWPFATLWFTGQCWRIKVPFLSIFLSNFLWWFLGQTNGGAEGDGALPCKSLLCLIFFFILVLILLWTGKRCDLCLIPTRFHFYLFSPLTEKRCDLSQQYDSQGNVEE